MLVPVTLASFGNLFGVDGLIILALGLLIFGRRLPEVGKNLGKTIIEFKKGLSGSYSEERAPEEPEEAAPPARRLSSGTRANTPAASSNRRRVAETEEV